MRYYIVSICQWRKRNEKILWFGFNGPILASNFDTRKITMLPWKYIQKHTHSHGGKFDFDISTSLYTFTGARGRIFKVIFKFKLYILFIILKVTQPCMKLNILFYNCYIARLKILKTNHTWSNLKNKIVIYQYYPC